MRNIQPYTIEMAYGLIKNRKSKPTANSYASKLMAQGTPAIAQRLGDPPGRGIRRPALSSVGPMGRPRAGAAGCLRSPSIAHEPSIDNTRRIAAGL
jgi:hypothetical protein